MASIRQLKSRIRSVKNTKQITKAMEMVAASKMRRTQDNTHLARDYTQAANGLLSYLSKQRETDNHPLFVTRDIKRRLIIVIASDRGLAGAYNANIAKKYVGVLHDDDKRSIENSTIAVGRKAASFVSRIKDTDVVGVYENIEDRPSGRELRSIADTAIKKFEDKEVDAVDIVYTKFFSAIRQEVVKRRILPAGFEETDVPQNLRAAIYEPDTETVFDATAYRLVEAQVFQSLLDAKASEYSMRMVAMKNATDNASDLTEDLTMEMNKERQANITQELAEISGGVEAMKE